MRIYKILAALAFATPLAVSGCFIGDDDDDDVVIADDCDTRCEDAHADCTVACTDDVCVADCDAVREDCVTECG